jgi:hypothetical protein
MRILARGLFTGLHHSAPACLNKIFDSQLEKSWGIGARFMRRGKKFFGTLKEMIGPEFGVSLVLLIPELEWK